MAVSSSTRATLATLFAPTLWFVHFLAVYIINALGCARGQWQTPWLGLPASSWIIVVVSVLSLAAIALVWYRQSTRGPQEGSLRFLLWLTGALSLLSALAIVWETIPVLMVPACG